MYSQIKTKDLSRSHRIKTLLQAIVVTLLWASSFVLIKLGLDDIPPLTFGSLRYFLAFLALVVLRLFRRQPGKLKLPPSTWKLLIGLGIVLYAIVPAAMFLGLNVLPAITVNFVFQAGIPIVAAVLSGIFLAEPTSRLEWLGVMVIVIGLYFFFPPHPVNSEIFAIGLIVMAALGVGGSNLITRALMRDHTISAYDVSMISMGIGSSLLLVISLFVETFPTLSWTSILILAWLSLINTAVAFTLWNHVMRTLTALEAGVIANAQVIEVVILAWLFLAERLTMQKLFASLVILAGIVIVHLHRTARQASR